MRQPARSSAHPPDAAPHRWAVAADRPHISLRLIAALSWLVPLVLLALAAWQAWKQEMAEVDAHVSSTLGIISEEAEKVFEAQEMALSWVDDRTRRLSWDEIERSEELHSFLVTMADQSDYIDAVWLADATGRERQNSRSMPLDRVLSVADRDYFIALQRDGSGIQIGQSAPGKLSSIVGFRMARRRSAPDGSFDGIIGASLSTEYFEKLLASMAGPSTSSLSLMRADGAILARSPTVPPGTSLPTDHPLWEAIADATNRTTTFTSPFDGVRRIGAVKRLRRYPLYVTFATSLDVVRRGWLEQLVTYSLVALASSLVLAGLSLAALRIARNERAALRAWRGELEHRYEIEAQLRQASKMEALGRMAGGIAHQFNNLLPALSALLDATRREMAPGSVTGTRLTRMLDAVEQGRRLVRQILIFGRRDIARLEPVDTRAVLDDAVAFMRGSLPSNVVLAVRTRSVGTVLGDRSQLHEAVVNLVSNAVHAIGRQAGTITLSADRVPLDDDEAESLGVSPGEYVRIVCSDDGAGMAPEVLERAFDPFFTTKPVGEGTGLGLAIVHGIVTGQGGGLSVQSAPGIGTSFYLYLPAAEAAEPATSPERSHAPHSG